MAKKRKKSKVKKRIIQALVLIALIGGLTWYFMPGAVPVDTDEARIGSLSATVEAEGRTRARERYLVWAPVAGTLQRLSIATGDPVVLDQLIARIVPDPSALADPQTAKQLGERLAAAEALKARAVDERDRAVAALDQVRADLRNTEQLAAAGQANAVQRDQAQFAVKLAFKEMESATHAVQAAAHDIAAAQAALRQLRQGAAVREWVVRAPLTGTALSMAGSGNIATGAALMEIGNPKDLEIVAETSAADGAQIKPGQRVVLTPKAGDGALEGRVRRVEPVPPAEVDAEPRHALVVIDFAAPPARWQDLGAGHEVRARITTATVDNVVKVAAGAVFADGQQSTVYVVENGKARKRAVTLGTRSADDVVIASGLREGERVILSPSGKIGDGVRVKMR